MKDGSLAPLFINQKFRFPLDIWIEAGDQPTKGFAHRPGWHCCKHPIAPHLSKKGRVWVEVEIDGWIEHQRPQSQGGTWYTANYMKVLRKLRDPS